MVAIGYIRLSDKDQASNSIASQKRRVEDYCQYNKLELRKIFVDDGRSGWDFNRPGFIEMERYCKTEKDISLLIIPHFDRFSRADPIDAMVKERHLRDKLGVKVLQVSEPVDTDTTSSHYQIIRFMQAFAANEERNRIVDRTITGMRYSLQQGRYCSNAPFGYEKGRDADGKPLLKVVETEATVVRNIYREFLKGTGIEEVKKMASKQGFSLKGKSAIQRVLTNPLYGGLVRVPAYKDQPEKLVKGIHLPIVTEGQYYNAMEKLTGKAHSSQPREDLFLRGVLYCHCGRKMTAAMSKGKAGKLYPYYFCETHRKENLSGTKLHAQFYEILDNLTFPPERLEAIRGVLNTTLKTTLDERGSRFMKSRLELQKVRDKIESVEEKYLLQPDLSPETYRKVTAKLKTEEAQLQTELQALAQDSKVYYDKINTLLDCLADMRGVFDRKSLNEKHYLIKTVFEPYLTYMNGSYRTQGLASIFAANSLILKEKGLLLVEQTFSESGISAGSPPGGT